MTEALTTIPLEKIPEDPVSLLRTEIKTAVETVTQREIVSDKGSNDRVERHQLKIKFLTRLLTEVEHLQELLPNLYISQFKGFRDFIAFLKDLPDEEAISGYFKHPTGAGKTVLFGLFLKLLDAPSLVLVPTKDLLHQTKRDLMSLGIPEEDIGIIGDELNEVGRKFTFRTYNGFLKSKDKRKYEVVVCDEGHRALGDKTQTRLSELGEDEGEEISPDELAAVEEFFKTHEKKMPNAAFLAFTATDALATNHVEKHFKRLISHVKRGDMVKAGILKKFISVQVDADILAEEENEKITLEKEREILEREDIYNKLLDKCIQFERENTEIKLRKMAFCQTVDECRKFQNIATTKGYKSIIVTAKEGGDRRKEAEDKILSGEIDIIITVDKLLEGWDFKPINAILWARATASPRILIQGAGRASRKYQNEDLAYFFEALWKLSRPIKETTGEGETPMRRDTKTHRQYSINALTLAQALANSGEDPEESLLGDLNYMKLIGVDEKGFGSVTIDGEAVDIVAACQAAWDHYGVTAATFAKRVRKAGIEPVEGVMARVGRSNTLVYPKDPVDPLFPKKPFQSMRKE